MLESFNTDVFEYQKLSLDEQNQRGILGRLKGVIADTVNPTRNNRKYSASLWEKVFSDPIMKERIENRCCFGELGHPADREETDMEKIALCLAEQPKKGKDGKLYGVFDILNTPNGRILKTLCDYGCNIGISSRGSGDVITDMNGDDAVDEDTYDCQGFDAVLIPAVKEARLEYVHESLDKKKYNKTLRTKLQESINKASADDRKVMQESLATLGVTLDEDHLGGTYGFLSKKAYKQFKQLSLQLSNMLSTYDKLIDNIEASNDPEELEQDPQYKLLIKTYNNNYETIRDLAQAIKEDVIRIDTSQNNDDILVGERIYKAEDLKDLLNSMQEVIDSVTINVNESVVNNEEILNEGRKNILQDLCIEICEYFDEADYPIKPDAWYGFTSWKEVADNTRFSPADILDTAEGLMEELEDYIITTDRLVARYNKGREGRIDREPFSVSDDPEYGLFSEWLQDLKYNFKLYVKEHGLDESLIESKKTEKEFIEDILKETISFMNSNSTDEYNQTYELPEGDAYIKLIDNVRNYIFDILKNNEVSENIAVDNNEAMMEELQTTLKQNKTLQTKLISLQEKLSVSYAKESKLQEELDKQKKAVSSLTKSANRVVALKERVNSLQKEKSLLESKVNANTNTISSLRESVSNNKKNNTSLMEQISSKNNKIEELSNQLKSSTEENKKLTESVNDLQKDIELKRKEYSKKLETNNQLIEKYKRIASTAVDKYITSKAISLGVTVNEIKNKLPESYTFSDIDEACESVQQYKVNLNKLPFVKMMTEDVKIKATPSKNEKLAIDNGIDDEVDDQLLTWANVNKY